MIFKKSLAVLLGVLTTLPLAADFHLTLTDSIVREYGADGGFPFTPSLSKTGDQAFVVYTINGSTTGQVVAELFDNTGGTLTSLRTITYNTNDPFNVIDNGFGSPDFKRFTLVADDNDANIRIRVYDKTLVQVQENTFEDYDPGTGSSYSGNGGQWSQDGKYILMTYLTNATPGSLTTIIKVLDSSSLLELASTTIDGGSFGGIFLQFHGKTYVAVTSYTTDDTDWTYGFDRENAGPNNPNPPPYASTLYVFEFSNGTLSLIDSAGLPQAADAPSGVALHYNALIGVGTSRAIKFANGFNRLTDEVTIFSDNTDKQSFYTTDGHEERIYKFNGSSLELAFSKNVNAGVQAPTFTPDAKHVFVDVQAIDGAPGFFRGYKINDRHHHMELNAETPPFISAPFYTGTVSRNGNWLLVTGSDQSSGDTNQPNPNAQMNDISLYRIQD